MPTYKVTERFVLHVGYSCNERCEFCYYLEDLKNNTAKDATTAENKAKIDLARRFGRRAIDISGGEPTIRKDLPELISYCRRNGFHTVTVITNGLKTADPEYCGTLKEAGLTEALFSIHSHSAEIHDKLTHVPGSFDRLMRSAENFSALGLPFRINTVVTNENYRYVGDFLAMTHRFRPATLNLIVFNPSETAASLDRDSSVRFSDYRLIGDAISSALDEWKSRFGIINVRFLPFCFLEKHPECVRTQWQKVHEDQEWDPILNVAFQKGWPAAAASVLAGAFMPWNSPRYRAADAYTLFNKWLSNFRMKLYYRQGSLCRECSLSPICTGVQKDYVKKFGFPEVKPFRLGKKIADPLHFCSSLGSIFQSLRKPGEPGITGGNDVKD